MKLYHSPRPLHLFLVLIFISLLTLPGLSASQLKAQSQEDLAKNTVLKKIVVKPDEHKIRYFFAYGNKERRLTYHFLVDKNGQQLNGNYNIIIRDENAKELATIKVKKDNITIESGKGNFTIENKPGIKLDKYLSPWNAFLVRQHFVDRPHVLGLDGLMAEFDRSSNEIATKEKWNIGNIQKFDGKISDLVKPGWVVSEEGDDGNSKPCSVDTQPCTFETVDGQTVTIYWTCVCAKVFCQTVPMTIEVKVTYVDPHTGAREEKTENRFYSICVCACVEIPED